MKHDAGSLKENQKEFMKNDKLMLKSKQRFRTKNYNAFTEEVNKIALSANNGK